MSSTLNPTAKCTTSRMLQSRSAAPPPSRWPPSSATSPSASSSPRTAICWASTTRARRCSRPSRKRSTTRSTPAKRPASCPRSGSTSKPTGRDRFKVGMQDNGPGIVKKQIPLIFGKLLYGSKFHRLRQSRGQQGIGISAAGMYGVQTTGKPVKIISKDRRQEAGPLLRNSDRHQAERSRRFSTATAKASTFRPATKAKGYIEKHGIEWVDHAARHAGDDRAAKPSSSAAAAASTSISQQTAIANPHITLHYNDPDGDAARLSALGRQAAAGAEGNYAASVRRRARPAGRAAHRRPKASTITQFLMNNVLARLAGHRPQDLHDGEDLARGRARSDGPQRGRRAVPGDSSHEDRPAGDRLHLPDRRGADSQGPAPGRARRVLRRRHAPAGRVSRQSVSDRSGHRLRRRRRRRRTSPRTCCATCSKRPTPARCGSS